MEDTMFFYWNTLKNILDEQIKDCKKYGDRFAKPYRYVRYLMDLIEIENGKIDGIYPDNCLWRRKDSEEGTSILSEQ